LRVLVWQWGRRGAGPRFAVDLAGGMRLLAGVDAKLSLSTGAEILRSGRPPTCDLPVPTYDSAVGYIGRLLQAPLIVRRLRRQIASFRTDVAVCAMPGPLDLLMAMALRPNRVPFAVIVHDADLHPGDGLPLQMFLQRRLIASADAVVAISQHTLDRLRQQGVDRTCLAPPHPPFVFGPTPLPPRSHDGALRLLFFGRLLPYKGLDLLAAAMRMLDARHAWQLRVVGSGPESNDLAALRTICGVTVENRWVPEEEVGELIAWADAVVLPYREASQSGVAPAAIAAGRHVVATRIGGLGEQLRDTPLAMLCEPDAASFAGALRALIDTLPSSPAVTPVDATVAWRDMAQQLLAKVVLHADPHH